MRNQGLVLLALVGTLLAAAPSHAANVAVFGDPAFVDASLQTDGGELEAIKVSLTALGHTVNVFTGITDWRPILAANDVVVIPELENGDLDTPLPDSTRAALVNFVLKGKALVVCGDGSARMVALLNNTFGYTLAGGGTSTAGVATQQPGAVGTVFAGAGPLQIADATVTVTNLPPGARDLYDFGGGSVAFTATVGAAGRVTFLGYDWFAPSGPPADWQNLLGLAITHGLAATPRVLKLAMYNDGTFVDTGTEAANLQFALQNMGHNVSFFTGTTDVEWAAALTNADVLVLPEFDIGDLNAALPAATKDVIRKFVLGGGGLLCNNDNRGPGRALFLLNSLFGYALTQGAAAAPYAFNAGAAVGTPFANGPATVPGPSATVAVNNASLPGGALALYVNGAVNAAFAVPRGLGRVVCLGFDWFSVTGEVPWIPLLSCGLEFAAEPSVLVPVAPARAAGVNGSVTVDLTPISNLSSVSLKFRKGGDASFQTTALGPIGNAAAGTIPGANLTNLGVQYYIEFGDGIGTGTFPRNAPFTSLNLPVNLTNQPVQSLAASTYKLAGIPMAASNPNPTSVFDELGGYNVANWRYGTFDGTTYREPGGGATNANPGVGFWIIAKNATNIATSGTSTNLAGPTIVTLVPGFNQIADPYAFPVDFADVIVPAGVQSNLIGFNGSGYVAGQTTLQPGVGYWIKNDNPTPSFVVIPPIGSGAPFAPRAALAPATPAADGWAIEANATVGRYTDFGNVMGTRTGALEGKDAFDLSEPPVPPSGWVRVHFSEPGSDALFADWRPKGGDGATWELSFASDQPGEPYAIDLLARQPLPAGWGIAVFDGAREVPLGTPARITGTVGAGAVPRTYRVSVGTAGYLAQVRSSATASIASFALAAPFPNPMRASVSVDLALPRAESDVHVEVFDASGRLVRTLLSGAQEAGIHRLQWDGLGNGGQRADVGLYFVRARAGAQLTSRKVALVR